MTTSSFAQTTVFVHKGKLTVTNRIVLASKGIFASVPIFGANAFNCAV